MTAEIVCPGCGASEACAHGRGCDLRPMGCAPCCHVLIWPDVPTKHLVGCEWNGGPSRDRRIMGIDYADVWYDLPKPQVA